MADKLYGLMADFEHPGAVLRAAAKCRDKGFRKWDVLTAFPVHGLDEAMGLRRSRVPFFTFCGGITGFTIGLFMVWYMNSFDYPLIVGGKPYFSPIFPFPVAYELTILLSAFGTIGGMFFLNRLPMHYHPTMRVPDVAKATDDGMRIYIEAEDPLFDLAETRSFLEEIGGSNIQELEDEE